ncbi:MAG: hypothetical protein EZS28_030337, partial [Streblomastix strix]
KDELVPDAFYNLLDRMRQKIHNSIEAGDLIREDKEDMLEQLSNKETDYLNNDQLMMSMSSGKTVKSRSLGGNGSQNLSSSKKKSTLNKKSFAETERELVNERVAIERAIEQEEKKRANKIVGASDLMNMYFDEVKYVVSNNTQTKQKPKTYNIINSSQANPNPADPLGTPDPQQRTNNNSGINIRNEITSPQATRSKLNMVTSPRLSNSNSNKQNTITSPRGNNKLNIITSPRGNNKLNIITSPRGNNKLNTITSPRGNNSSSNKQNMITSPRGNNITNKQNMNSSPQVSSTKKNNISNVTNSPLSTNSPNTNTNLPSWKQKQPISAITSPPIRVIGGKVDTRVKGPEGFEHSASQSKL